MTDSGISPGIIWLASYPKSGNTWVRLFLGALEIEREIDLARMDGQSSGAVSRSLLQRSLGIDLAEMSQDEVTELRPLAYRSLARRGRDLPTLFKVHDGYYPTPSGAPLFPPEATDGCVHLVRDPRDVCLSLAAHNGTDIDRAIDQMGRVDFCAGQKRLAGSAQVAEFRGSWSQHGESWMAAPVRCLTVRYEDMLADPMEWLGRIAAFCRRPCDPAAVAAAVERTAFDRLAEREAQSGFIERPNGMERFFRSGTAGQWRDRLSRDQIARIERDHGPLMERLGYQPVSCSALHASE